MKPNQPKVENIVSSSDHEAETFGERLKSAIGDQSIRAFSLKCGISDKTIRQYIAGDVDPTRMKIKAMADELFLDPGALAYGSSPLAVPPDQSDLESEFEYVDSWSVKASAGEGEEVHQELVINKMAFRKDWLKSHGLDRRKLSILKAKGDSMYPTIYDGDTLLITTYFYKEGTRYHIGKQPESINELRDGLYVIRIARSMLVKRLQILPGGSVEVISDNESYKPFVIPPDGSGIDDQIQIIGRVEWVGRKF